MTSLTLDIIFPARDLAHQSEVELAAQTLDIELQEAALGTITGTHETGETLVLSAEINDEGRALTLVRTLLRSLSAPPSTQLVVRQADGVTRALTLDEQALDE